MKKIISLLLLLYSFQGITQRYSLYSNDSMTFDSKFLQRSITLNVHLPETFNFSQTTYPITIVFDSQHERTYPQIISSIDLLTSETQIPEMIVIGVPFNVENRYYLTSNQKLDGDSLSGIERFELFLFNELIPKLKKEKKANNFLSICGHSRTAYLVNYLAVKRFNEINIAISLSGFFSEKPLSTNSFDEFLQNTDKFKNKFSYYATSGNTLEESTYLTEYQKIFKSSPYSFNSNNLKIHFKENSSANHMTNYWTSVPEILIDAFSEYNLILDNWFHKKLKENPNLKNPVHAFEMDIKKSNLGFEVNPSLTHIFSLASHFGYQQDEFQKAIEFMNLGLRYYPEYLDFYIEIIEFYKLLENESKVDDYKAILRKKALENKFISESYRLEILNYLDEK